MTNPVEGDIQRQPAHDPESRAGAVLVAHGLNLRPERMGPLAAVVEGWGLRTKHVVLHGHGPNDTTRTFAAATGDIWQSDMIAALGRGTGPAPAIVAYSLGALCYLAALAHLKEESPADYREPAAHILLAPALIPRAWSQLFRLGWFWPGLVIPSLNPISYRRHKGTPIGAYRALAALMVRFRRAVAGGFRLENPVLMAIHPGDELVSPRKTEHLLRSACAREEGFRLLMLNNRDATIRPKFAHLILDADCLGPREFQRLSKAIGAVLKEGRLAHAHSSRLEATEH